MKPLLALIFLSAFQVLSCFTGNQVDAKQPATIGNQDSIVQRADNYIQYVNGLAGHVDQYVSTYIKIAGHRKFIPNPDFEYWPDSIEETISLVRNNKEPVEYAETPLVLPKGTNLEYDNYYYRGKILAYRVFEVITNNDCTGGSLTNTMIAYYDSTGKNIKTLRKMFGSDNQVIDSLKCPGLNDFSHLYKSYSETPLAKEGVEKRGK
jgi:hypothetical protein